ncbi:MAG: hypothetical protein QXV17_12710 [Candidatus Micrarchaeaceae archaeon]
MADDNRNIFKALGRGILIGFPFAFLFVLFAYLFTDMGSTNTFLISVPAMALLGEFIGIGIEIYPELYPSAPKA